MQPGRARGCSCVGFARERAAAFSQRRFPSRSHKHRNAGAPRGFRACTGAFAAHRDSCTGEGEFAQARWLWGVFALHIVTVRTGTGTVTVTRAQ